MSDEFAFGYNVHTCHQSVKKIATSKKWKQHTGTWCQRMIFQVQHYQVWIKGANTTLQFEDEEVHRPYHVGDPLWLKPPNSWCTTIFRKGCVTGVNSKHSVLVDWTPHHIKVASLVTYPLTQAHQMIHLDTCTIHLWRSTCQNRVDFYGRVKDYSPMMKYTAKKTSSQQPPLWSRYQGGECAEEA